MQRPDSPTATFRRITVSGSRRDATRALALLSVHDPIAGLGITGDEDELEAVLDGDVVALIERMGYRARGAVPIALPLELSLTGVLVCPPGGRPRPVRRLEVRSGRGVHVVVERDRQAWVVRVTIPHEAARLGRDLTLDVVGAGVPLDVHDGLGRALLTRRPGHPTPGVRYRGAAQVP